jgi:mannose-1-phosphate guanylyltransferase
MKAMVLAAGLGTRLHPINSRIPKAMMPIFGTPIIELNLLQLRDQGIKDVIVNLHHLPVQIIRHLQDGSSWGMRIRYSLEPTILGTAGGIKKVEDFFDHEAFLVMNADTYRNTDLEGLLSHHRKTKSVITMLLEKNPELATERAVWLDDRGCVVRFLNTCKKEIAGGIAADFLGVQVIEPKVLLHIPPGQPWEISQVYIRLLSSGLSIGGYLHGGYWMDVGTWKGYRQIHLDAMAGVCPMKIPGFSRNRGVWVGEYVHIEPGAKIEPPVFLGPETVVRRKARVGPYAVVGRHCTIESGARVIRSILWEDVQIRARKIVEDQLVGCGFEHALG